MRKEQATLIGYLIRNGCFFGHIIYDIIKIESWISQEWLSKFTWFFSDLLEVEDIFFFFPFICLFIHYHDITGMLCFLSHVTILMKDFDFSSFRICNLRKMSVQQIEDIVGCGFDKVRFFIKLETVLYYYTKFWQLQSTVTFSRQIEDQPMKLFFIIATFLTFFLDFAKLAVESVKKMITALFLQNHLWNMNCSKVKKHENGVTALLFYFDDV